MSDDEGWPMINPPPDWSEPVDKSIDGRVYQAMIDQVRNELCAAMGLPAYLFRPAIKYRDPYPEEGE